MPKKLDDDKFEFIPVDEDIAEWRKNPKIMKEYYALKPEFDRVRREIRAKDARIARRKRQKVFVARVRAMWGSITRGIATLGGGGRVL